MSDNTKIEWADATWNVVIGCDKVSPGCDHCYAIRTAHRMQANPNPDIASAYAGTEADGEWTGRVNLLEGRLDLPARWTKPRRIFVNAQSDLFHDDVPNDFIARVWAVMALAQRHTFQILTKRHGRMRSMLKNPDFEAAVQAQVVRESGACTEWPPPNVWLGVSVEDQKRADLRVPALLDTPAAIRFLSCEPLLGPVSLFANTKIDTGTLVDWVIVGGESGPGARPMHPGWARGLREECTRYGIAFHFKQWGEWRWVREAEDVAYERTHGDQFPQRWECIDREGRLIENNVPVAGGAVVQKVGKRKAGRELDGRTWDEFPEAVTV